MRKATRLALLLLPALLGRPARCVWAQAPPGPAPMVATDLSEVLSGRSIPLSLRLGDLDASWRTFNAGGATSITSYSPFSSIVSESPGASFYTRGQTVVLSDATLLVAYRLALSPLQLQAQEQAQPRRYHSYTEPPPTPKLPAQTPLVLTLLNVRQMAALSDIRPFDASIISSASTTPDELAQQDADAASVSNLKQLGLALLQYTQDYDERLPPMKSATSMRQITAALPGTPQTVQATLLPYARNPAIFAHPGTREIYRPNPILSGKSLQHIAQPSAMVAFYEASPGRDNKRAVLFVDGHVKRIAEEDWPRLKRASRIPAQ